MLLQHLKKYKWYMIIGPFFKLLETILELFNPLFVAQIIDHGVESGDINFIIRYGIIILVANILGFAFSMICQKCASLTSAGVSNDLRATLFEKISSFSHSELDKFGTASLVNRLTNDIMQVETAVSIFIRLMIRVPFLLIGAFVLSLVINIKTSLIFLVLIPLMLVILVIYMRKTTPFFTKMRNKLDRISKITKENLSGTRVIRAFNKQEDEEKRFSDASEDYTATSIRVSKMTALLNPLIYLIVNLATIALLYIGSIQINIGQMSQGDVIALIDYIAIITISLLILSQMIVLFVRTGASVTRLDEVIKTEPSILSTNTKRIKRTSYDAILEFKNVSFNYSNSDQDISFIKNLSFSLYPKQTLGIIGGTGSGKTTIANLITRFYDATQGEVLYKGRNVKEYPISQLREEISIVQQRSTLFSGTLRENMKIRNKNASDEEIIEALKISQAWSFVSEWANGLDHQIMAGGKNVSGGQMQRLTIARAIIGKPELLILDDSSSALDFLTDSNLRRELKKLDCTLVTISQRATSIKNADLIIVLDNGDVVGIGKHNKLMKDCEIYREIYESQAK